MAPAGHQGTAGLARPCTVRVEPGVTARRPCGRRSGEVIAPVLSCMAHAHDTQSRRTAPAGLPSTSRCDAATCWFSYGSPEEIRDPRAPTGRPSEDLGSGRADKAGIVTRTSIFISHTSTETKLAQHLKERLESDFLGALQVFVSSDQTSIGAGTKWLDEVEKALKSAALHLVLCSDESVGRPWVNFEAGAAWLRGVPVIPVCHSGMTPTGLPVPLILLEAIEAHQEDDLRKLYAAASSALQMTVPRIDFAALSAEVRDIEQGYRRARSAIEIVEDPQVLCAATEQWARFGFERDVAVLENAFPGRVAVEPALTRSRLRTLLTNNRFDIVHLVLAVDDTTGDMIFSPVEASSPQHWSAGADSLSARGFADLLAESQTRLVVLATCDALLLAVEVSGTANMAASNAEISPDEAIEWEETFYGLLSEGKSVFKSFDLTRSQSKAPIRHIRHRDVVFGRPGGMAPGPAQR